MPGQRVLLVSELAGEPLPPSWLRRILERVVDVRTLSLTAPIDANAHSLVQFRPTILYGFPSYLLALAACGRDHGWKLPRVTLVYTSSEVLTESARRALADAYGGRVIDVYGSTEFKEIAVQCHYGAYHVNFESVYVESVADEKRGPPRLLVTTLVNKAMPLIRYEIGDTGWLVDEACPCGRESPQVVGLQGRVSEVLSFPDGTSVSPLALRIEILAVPPLSASDLMALEGSLRRLLPAAAALRFVALTERGSYTKRRAVSREF
jgi:phenylacetate-coenzyme A ligase PaaK-like adenylate-forming protein